MVLFLAAGLATVLLVIVLVAADPKSAGAAFPGTNGQIAFASDRSGNFEIWRMEPNGTSPRNLTNSSLESDRRAAYSPNGNKIAFGTDRDGSDEIYTMSSLGLLQTRLTKNSVFDCCPAYSPDGTKIVFSSSRGSSGQDIWVMNADGSGQRRLTGTADHDLDPAWSPNGKKLAFVSNLGGDREVWVMNSDGTNEIQLTDNSVEDSSPDWSPDDTKIVFDSNRGGDLSNSEIYRMKPAREGPTNQPVNLTKTAGRDLDPAYSPDGTKIAFVSDRDGDAEIFVMNATGTSQDPLTTNSSVVDAEPTWQPRP